MAYRWLTSLKTRKSNKQVRQRKKSHDVMANMASNKGNLSDAIVQANEGYAAISTSDLCLTSQRTKPTKLSVDLITTTPFEIIEIKGKVHKCASCGGLLKDGPFD